MPLEMEIMKKSDEIVAHAVRHLPIIKYYNVARLLDKDYKAGTMRIFTEISRWAVLLFDDDTRQVSFDTISISVYGEYEKCFEEAAVDVPFVITHGYSKDHRPDLKQFLISMLCVDGNIPVV